MSKSLVSTIPPPRRCAGGGAERLNSPDATAKILKISEIPSFLLDQGEEDKEHHREG